MPGGNHHHRAGSLKQSNKRNKRTKASKRSIKSAAGGRVSAKVRNGLFARTQSKADRRHMQKQRRDASKQALLLKKRGHGESSSRIGRPPRIVGIISLGEYEKTEEHVRTLLLQSADKITRNGSDDVKNDDDTTRATSNITAKYNVHKKDGTVTYLTNSTAFRPHYDNDDESAPVLAALDLCRICDVLLFVIDGNGPEEVTDGDGMLGMQIGGETDEKSVRSRKSHSSTTTIGRNWDHLISDRGDRILEAIKAQGLPTPITILAHTMKQEGDETLMGNDNMTIQSSKSMKSIRRGAFKRRAELKRYATRFATTEFGVDNNKVMELDLTVLNNDGGDDDSINDMKDDTAATKTATSSVSAPSSSGGALVRTICNMSAQPPKWVSSAMRSYIVSDDYQYHREKQEIHITGFTRGPVPFNINSLIHIPNLGTFGCKYLQKSTHALSSDAARRKRKNNKGDVKMEDDDVNRDDDVLWSNPSKRESLEMFAAPDALDGEQNLVGFDEHDEEFDDDGEEDENKKNLEGVERPAGWSDYQSAWLDAVDTTDGAGTLGETDDMDHGELAKALNQKSSNKSVGTAGGGMDLDEEDNEVSAKERQALLEQRKKDHKDELEFPDEVEIAEDVNARDRYARYRALKSFRKSFWDPKENLPESYASIYHFSSFKGTQRDVMADMKDTISQAADSIDNHGGFWGCSDPSVGDKNKDEDEDGMMADDNDDDNDDDTDDEDLLDGCVPTGSYVTVVIEKVSPKIYDRISPKGLVTAVTLLPHENKASVLHMGLSRHGDDDDINGVPIKSKDVLTFRCGWRTWRARPVFSQNNLNSDKHKFERFLPPSGSFFAASVFGPVTYTPCPVLVFRDGKCGKTQSIAESTAENDDGMTATSNKTADSSSNNMVAIGTMIGADADRMVIKRIILTGYPTRVHKRHATVKYMFYNPDDVVWFKPAELTTKHGLHGNIIESVGEHGTMKCLFNAPIKQHDTVCLPLYKRIYPKLAPIGNKDTDDGNDNLTKKSVFAPNQLVVL